MNNPYQDAIDSFNVSIQFCESMQKQAKTPTASDYVKMHITFIKDIIQQFDELKAELEQELRGDSN